MPEEIYFTFALLSFIIASFCGFVFGVKFSNFFHLRRNHFKTIYDVKTNTFEHLETLYMMKHLNISSNYNDFITKEKLPDTALNAIVFLKNTKDFFYLAEIGFSDRIKLSGRYDDYLRRTGTSHSIVEICMFLNERGLFK